MAEMRPPLIETSINHPKVVALSNNKKGQLLKESSKIEMAWMKFINEGMGKIIQCHVIESIFKISSFFFKSYDLFEKVRDRFSPNNFNNQGLVWVSLISGSAPSTWVIFHCFSQANSRKLHSKWACQDQRRQPQSMPAVQGVTLLNMPHSQPQNKYTFLHFFKKIFYIYLKEWQRNRLFFWFIPQMAEMARTALGQDAEPGIASWSPCEWQGPITYTVLGCFPRNRSRATGVSVMGPPLVGAGITGAQPSAMPLPSCICYLPQAHLLVWTLQSENLKFYKWYQSCHFCALWFLISFICVSHV